MKIKATLATVLASFALMGAAVAATSTSVYQTPGNQCQSWGTVNTALDHYHYTGNPTASGVSLYCPVSVTTPITGIPATQMATVLVVDNTTTDSVYCEPLSSTGTGGLAIGTLVYSCSTPGGCTSSTPSFSGASSFSWYVGLHNEGFSQFGAGNGFFCYLPAQNQGMSLIVSQSFSN